MAKNRQSPGYPDNYRADTGPSWNSRLVLLSLSVVVVFIIAFWVSPPPVLSTALTYPQVFSLGLVPQDRQGEGEFELLPSASSGPCVSAEAAVLVDADTGAILFEKNPRERLYPASVTKVLTGILAIEKSKLDDKVTISKRAAEVDGSRVYLVEGEIVTVRELLYALILNSANDAAIALAEHVSGSVEEFCLLMNQMARRLGATGSNFTNPHGLHEPEHFTTALDMALICRYAMENPIFREIAGAKTFPWNGREWQSTLINHNRLLWRYPNATGIKTGYTDISLHTLVASAEKEGHRLIAVLLKAHSAEQLRTDAISLFDYGFKEYSKVTVVNKGETLGEVEILGRKVGAVTAQDLFVTVPAGCAEVISREIRHRLEFKPLSREVKKGEIIGSVVYYVKSTGGSDSEALHNEGSSLDSSPDVTVLGRVALVAAEEVRLGFVETLVSYVKRLFVGVGALAVVGWWVRGLFRPVPGTPGRSVRRRPRKRSGRMRPE